MSIPSKSWSLWLFYVLAYWFPLNWRPLWIPDETRYGQISQAMVLGADWINPHFLGLRYYEKPILGYWLNNLSLKIFGFNPFGVRFMCALSTGIAAYLIYRCALRLWQSRQVAYVSAFIYLSTPLILIAGVFSTLDALLTLWLNAAIVSFIYGQTSEHYYKRWLGWILLGFFAGLAFLTKGFVAWAVLFIIICPWMLYRRAFKELILGGLLTVLTACLVAMPWVIAVQMRAPDYWHYFFWTEHIQRFFSSNAQHASPIWYFIPILLIGILPWLGFLPAAFYRFKLLSSEKLPATFLFLISWIIFPLLFFSISRGKLPLYILICFAPMALILARNIVYLFESNRKNCLKRALLFWILVCVCLIGAFIWLYTFRFNLPEDHLAKIIAITLSSFWLLCALIAYVFPQKLFLTMGVSVVAFTVSFPFLLPAETLANKMPTTITQNYDEPLKRAATLAADYPSLASVLAWQTQREKVYLIDQKGEVSYGLSYPDSKLQIVNLTALSDWITTRLEQGSVAILVRSHSEAAKQLLKLNPTKIVPRHGTILIFFEPK